MGNGASVQAPGTADIHDLFEDTVFDELEVKRITAINSESGLEGILAKLLPMPILPHILLWLRGITWYFGNYINDKSNGQLVTFALD